MPSVKTLVWRNKLDIKMGKDVMLVPSMRGRMEHMLRESNHHVPNAKKMVWRREGSLRMAKRGMLAPSTRSRMAPYSSVRSRSFEAHRTGTVVYRNGVAIL